jgi:hypothetical protein
LAALLLDGDDFSEKTIYCRVSDGDHFLIGPVLDWVLYIHGRRVSPESARLNFGAIDELRGGNEYAWDAAALKIDDVVHTARRTTTSIG